MIVRFAFVNALSLILSAINVTAAQSFHQHDHGHGAGGMDDFIGHDPMVRLHQPSSGLRLDGRHRAPSLVMDPILPGAGISDGSLGIYLSQPRRLSIPLDHAMERASLSLPRLGLGDLPMLPRRTAHLDLHTDRHALDHAVNRASLPLSHLGRGDLPMASLGAGHLHGDPHLLDHGMDRVGGLFPISSGPLLGDAHHIDHGMDRVGMLHGAMIERGQRKRDKKIQKKIKKNVKKQVKKHKKMAKKQDKRLKKLAKLQRKHAVTGKDKYRRKIGKVVRKLDG